MAEEKKLKTSPKDFFLHLLSMVTLYASAISFLTVVFQIINLTIPNPLEDTYTYLYEASKIALRTGLSILIIMFPAYLGTLYYLGQSYKKNHEKKELRVRKWLIYFTLFVTAVIILISLIMLVNRLLEGDIALRFILKLLSVLAVAGSIFWYYLSSVRTNTED